jgi:hypothetical protein
MLPAIAVGIVLMFFLGFPAGAQSPQGTILGTVTDSSGALVSGAKVTITNQDTHVVREFSTNNTGYYNAPFMPVAVYMVTVEAQGFKKSEHKDVKIYTGQTARIDVVLTVGDVASSVTVSGGGVQLIQTEKPTLSDSIGTLELKELPSNGRYFMNYLALSAGTSGISNTVINGGQRLAVNFVMDGVNIKDMSGGAYTAEVTNAGPSVESMEEVTVKSSTAGTDTGIGTSEVHLITKSGSNHFHGSLLEYYRGNFAEARNEFNATNKIPRTVRNQFGGSFSGPIIKNKTFFFFNYEGFELRSGTTTRLTVPTAQERGGDFSDYTGISVLRDPLSGTSVTSQTPFPNKTIPTSRIDAVANKVLNYFNYPVPNLPGLNSNYIYSLVSPQNVKQYTLKVDHMLSPKDTLSVRSWQAWTYSKGYQGWDTKSAIAFRDYLDTNLQGTWSRIFTPAVSNELRFGWWNMPRSISTEDPGQNLYDTLGISGVTNSDPAMYNAGPRFNFTGTGVVNSIGVSSAFPQIFKTRTGTITDTVSIVKSHHTIKAGTQILIAHEPWTSTSNIRGTILYNGASSLWWSTNNAFADMLMGIPYNSQLAQPAVAGAANLRESDWGFYATDDWKVTPNFTMTMGLRWDYLTPMTEQHDVGLSMYDPYTHSVVVNSPTLLSNFPSTIGGGSGLPIVTSRSLGLGNALQEPDKNNWGPRVGLAWRPLGDNNMVIRGGYGIYYADQCLLWQGRQNTNQPWVSSYSYYSMINSTTLLSNAQPFQSGSKQSASFYSMDRYFKTSYTQQWNATVEKTFKGDYAWRLSYVGNKGTKLRQPLNIDQAISVAKVNGTNTYTYPITELSGATTFYSIANSTYNSMQNEVKKRWSKGLLFTANWTWAKGIETDHDDSTPMNSYNLNLDRANSMYVSRHTVSAWAVYEMPFGHHRTFLSGVPRWADAIVGGWNLSGISRYWTGQYATLTASNVGTRPDVVPGVDPFQGVPAGRWFNAAAYTDTPYDSDHPTIVFGNCARNSLKTPNQYQLDVSMAKSFTVREGQKFTVKVESFNMPNHPNLGMPATNIDNAISVGTITSAGQARYFQWSARYEF